MMTEIDSLWAGLAEALTMPTWAVLMLKTTLLLTLAWFLHVALARFNPRWRVLLWRGTACGVMLVAVWSFGLPVVEVGIPMPETTFAVPVVPSEPVGVEEVAFKPIPPDAVVSREMSMPIDPPPTAPRTPAVTVPTETSTANRASIPWRTVLLILWPLGITALALRLFAGHARLSRHLARSCTSAPDSILAEVRRLAADLGCRRRIRVLQSPKFTIPFIFGILRPVLVLPEKMCRADYTSRLPGILAHELSHVRSADFAWNLILQAVSIPLWFHPLAWRIASAHRRACDAVCDAVSASYLGDVRSYCRTLAKVALEDAASATFPAVGLAMARRCDVRRRVAALERAVFAAPLRRRVVAATVVLGLLGAVLLAGVGLTRAEVAAETEKEVVEESAKGEVSEAGGGPAKVQVEGTVRDPKGRPVAGALVGRFVTYTQLDYPVTTTDEKGRYRLPPCKPGEYTLAVVKKGYAPGSRRLEVDSNRRTFDLSLVEGKPIRIKVVDTEGKPLPGAAVLTAIDRETLSLDGKYDRESKSRRSLETDSEGRWGRLWLPGESLWFVIRKEGYEKVNVTLGPSEEEHLVTLNEGGWAVSGRVTDGETNEPVTEFRLVEGHWGRSEDDEIRWREDLAVQDKEGKYRNSWNIAGNPQRAIRIEADGYLPSEPRRIGTDEREVTFHVGLRKGTPIAGIVRGPDGTPAAGVPVTMVTADRRVRFENNARSSYAPLPTVQTGADGRFTLPPRAEPYVLVAFREDGFAKVESREDTANIKLHRWARVEGTFRIGGRAAAEEEITLKIGAPLSNRKDPTPFERIAERLTFDYKTRTDSEGRFVFDRVAPEKGRITRYLTQQRGRASVGIPTYTAEVELSPGETAHVDLSRAGRPIVGRLAVPPAIEQKPDWNCASASLTPAERTPDDFTYAAAVRVDGTFVFDDVPAGKYELNVHLESLPPTGKTGFGDEIAGLTKAVSVAEMPGGRSDEAMDLGELVLEAVKGADAKESAPDERAPDERKTEVGASEENAPPEAKKETSRPPTRSVRVLTVDPNGKPLADVGVTVRAMTDVPHGPDRYKTNEEGIAVIETPILEEMKNLQILLHTPRRVTVGGSWDCRNLDLKNIPDRFTATLEPGTTFGGVVRDEAGRPVTGAKVTVDGRKRAPDGVLWWSIHDTSETDAEGKWRCEQIPADLEGFDVSVEVRHREYVNGPAVDLRQFSVEELRAGTAVLTVRPGIVVTGTVRGPKGRPLPGALVGLFVDPMRAPSVEAITDEKGAYRLPGCEPGEYTLAVAAEGYAPGSREAEVAADKKTFDLSVVEGKPIRIRVLDDEGNPLSGAAVDTIGLSAGSLLDYRLAAQSGKGPDPRTDDEGRWSRLWIPKEKPQVSIHKDGYERVEKVLSPGDEEHVVTLRKGGWTIAGRVTNAETGEPVTEFRLVEKFWLGVEEMDFLWRDGFRVRNENGEYRKTWNTSGEGRRVVRIEAERFLPCQPRHLKVDERYATFDVKLRPADPVTGTVRDPEGNPAADVEVVLVTATRGVNLNNGSVGELHLHLSARTGPDGKFSLPPQDEPYVLLALDKRGFGEVTGGEGANDITIRPWARLEGTFSLRGKPKTNEAIRLHFHEPRRQRQDLSALERIRERIVLDYRIQTDAQGRFQFDRLFPGKGSVMRCVVRKEGSGSLWSTTHQAEVEFVSGKTARVDLGRGGKTVTGKFTLSDGVKGTPDWARATVTLGPWVEPPRPTAYLNDPAVRENRPGRQLYQEWLETPEGKTHQTLVDEFNARPRGYAYYGKVESDGSFYFDNIRPGEYQLRAEAPTDRTIASCSRVFTVSKRSERGDDEAVDLGTVELKGVERRADGVNTKETAPAKRSAAEQKTDRGTISSRVVDHE